ncbi:queuosine precursor transporter [Robbsia andropogonis]|uniref:queuosine precursor transporter n=1 Tax=Robbsia andropogonis TaxID=28092 RepID=UPI00046542FB|nr:queuosine precursor transporter [Robbsia andropogonis]MCP1117852.1 queuosine precursor transporter [Robbsia andropogonis]MCP1127316.1 queuosine precursor transporter [Robbsia andropogonis]
MHKPLPTTSELPPPGQSAGTSGESALRPRFRYYDLFLAAFVVVLICSNLIGAGKVAVIDLPGLGLVSYSAGVLFFPISYAFGDIMTEVYGYAYDRRAVWTGFGALIFMAVMSAIVLALPAANSDYMHGYQQHLEGVFGNTPRIVVGSIVAFWTGSLVNAFVLAKMKILTSGRMLWLRTIGSTAVGEAFDSSLFYVIAFYGIWPTSQVWHVALAQYLLKTSWEVLATPLTYWIVGWLKRVEHHDHYDRDTNFTPFRLRA